VVTGNGGLNLTNTATSLVKWHVGAALVALELLEPAPITGGYWEWRPLFDAQGRRQGETARWCGAGSFRTARANTYHRIELDPDVTCWTLFMPGAKQRDWGFLVKNKWVQWEQYLIQRKTT